MARRAIPALGRSLIITEAHKGPPVDLGITAAPWPIGSACGGGLAVAGWNALWQASKPSQRPRSRKILDGPREDRLWTNFATLEQLEAIRHLLGAELIYDDGATLRPTDRTLATFGINGEFNTLRGPRVELERDRRAADIT